MSETLSLLLDIEYKVPFESNFFEGKELCDSY